MHTDSDIMLHLAGEQTLPLYIGMKQFDCMRHVFVCTDKTALVPDLIRKVLSGNTNIETLTVPPYDAEETELAVRKRVDADPEANWVFNLTGGTKPMFAAAWRALPSDAQAFYVETTNHNIYWLSGKRGKTLLKPCMKTVEEFVMLAGSIADRAMLTRSAKIAEKRQNAATACYRQQQLIAKTYRELQRYTNTPGVPFSYHSKDVGIEQKGPEHDYEGFLRIGKQEFRAEEWKDIASFVAGGWLEELTWLCSKRLLETGKIADLALRLSPLRPASALAKPDPVQEFDVSFTDGFFFTIIECKAGEVRQEAIQKLENLARTFGGHFGRGVLVCAQPRKVSRETWERIRNSSIVAAVSADETVRNPDCLLTVRPARIPEEADMRKSRR